MIFKRFYREEEVHDIEGIGIGLYLAREIVTMQGDISKLLQQWAAAPRFLYFCLMDKIFKKTSGL